MGTRLYLINGILNNTLSEEDKQIALNNPVIMNAVNDIKSNQNKESEKSIKKTVNKKGGK